MIKKILLAILLIVIVVVIGLGITAKYYAPKIAVQFMNEDKAIVMQTVDQFLFNIRDGKVDEAYNVTMKGDITRQSLDDAEFRKSLQNFIGQDPQLYKYRVTKFLGGRYTVQYFTATDFSDGQRGQIAVSVTLDKGDEVWKIAGYHWATLPDKIW